MSPKWGFYDYSPGPLEISHRVFQDPAPGIRTGVAQALANRFSLDVVDDAAPDLVLAIWTTGFALAYPKANSLGAVPNDMVLWYDATLKLTDTRTHQVLAEGTCESRPLTGANRLTSWTDRAVIGELVEETVQYCTDDFRHRLLELY